MIAKLLIPFVVLIFASVPIAFSQGLASLFLRPWKMSFLERALSKVLQRD